MKQCIYRIFFLTLILGNNTSSYGTGLDLSGVPLTIKVLAKENAKSPEYVLNAKLGLIPQSGGIKQPMAVGSFWAKISVRSTKKQPITDWVFIYDEPTVDYLDAYVYLDGKKIAESKVGDQRPFSNRPLPINLPNTTFRWDGTGELDIILKVKSKFMVGTKVHIMTLKDFHQSYDGDRLMLYSYAAVIIFIFCYHMLVFIVTRLAEYFHYSLIVTGYFLATMAISGVGCEFFWRDIFWLQQRAIPLALAIIFWAFRGIYQCFFESEGEPPQWETTLHNLYSAQCILIFFTALLPDETYSLMLAAILFFPLSLHATYFIFLTPKRVVKSKLIKLGIILTLLSAVSSLYARMDPDFFSFYTVNAFFFGSIIELALFSIALAQRINEIKARKEALRRSLSGVVSNNVLSQLEANPHVIPEAILNEEMTVMFIDICGFSKVFDTVPIQQIVIILKETLNGITKIIHEHGGTVDRTLGDGILCFFGVNLLGERSSNHPYRALQAAIQIQRENIAAMNRKEGYSIFPLRIGVNTDSVFVGNIGMGERFDYTVIGQGVNFANRLEDSSSPHGITFSQNTFDKLPDNKLDKAAIKPVLVQIKHSNEWHRAYQYDFSWSDRTATKLATKRHWAARDFRGPDKRYESLEPKAVWLESKAGRFCVQNFSKSGIGLSGQQMLGRKLLLIGHIKSNKSGFNMALEKALISQITIEVCWAENTGSTSFIGGKLKALTIEQRKILFMAYVEHIEHKEKQNIPKAS